MPNFSLATTADGSLSLREHTLDELYHNQAGAFSEAITNYVQPAVQFLQEAGKLSGPLHVLDSCFGLGYNSLALANFFEQETHPELASIVLQVDAVELDPDVLEVVPQVLSQPCFAALQGRILEELNFHISICDLRQFVLQMTELKIEPYDLIFHDPFSPKKVPQLWSVDLFERYYQAMSENSALLTYACAPAVRGALISLGFKVFRTTGLGRKSGGTIAIKSSSDKLIESLLSSENSFVHQIEGEELRRLGKSSQVPFRDPLLCDSAEAILVRRQSEQANFQNSAKVELPK